MVVVLWVNHFVVVCLSSKLAEGEEDVEANLLVDSLDSDEKDTWMLDA